MVVVAWADGATVHCRLESLAMKNVVIASVLVLASATHVFADDAPSIGGMRVGISPGVMFFSAHGQSSTGYGGNAWVGYEIEHGALAFTPLIDLGYTNFNTTPSTNLTFAIPTLQIADHLGAWVPALEFGVGYAYSWVTANNVTLTDNFLALSVGAQLDYRITQSFMLGVAAHYKPFVEPALNSFVDVGVNATFAL